VEGVPYRLEGKNTLSRQVTYAGRTYTVQEPIAASAEVNYVFGGYQYDFISRERGHLGALGGVAYLDASGTIRSTRVPISATESERLALPLAGLEFRVFATRLVNVNGEVKGMSIGRFGHYVQGSLNLGIRLARWATLQGGYMILDTEVHNRGRTVAFSPRFTGPVLSLQFRQ
jgi:hypothetical protein